MVFDYSKLKGRMAENGFNQKDLAEAIGISENAISKKLKNGEAFKSRHILLVCQKLHIPMNDVGAYFFVKQFD